MAAHPYTLALVGMLIAAVIAWLYSLRSNDVSFVDSLWSLFFVLAAVVFAYAAQPLSDRALLVLALVTIWALRLSVYITARNWAKGEDYRYQTIRKNNQPGFSIKSLYIVFGLQAVLAWVIAMPLLPAIAANSSLTVIDGLAAVLWLLGFTFEAIGDWQLARFKRNPANRNRVMDRGLWRYTRHPNYFGDFCVWWAFYLFAVSAGGWWSIASPIIMSILLLRVSGVAMLENTIGERRPGYANYVERTNAFFPGPRRMSRDQQEMQP